MKQELEGSTALELVKEFGSPLYVYCEKTLQENCKKIKKFSFSENFFIHYAMKANSNIALLKIIAKEGLKVETISPFEVASAELAGFGKEDILYSSNNITAQDMQWVINKEYFICLDAVCQLERYWQLGGKKPVCIRLNPMLGAGHHDRVITAGKVKFGIDFSQIPLAFELAKKYQSIIRGFNIHIGSLFLNPDTFHQSVEELLKLAENYPSIDYLDFGGGFGIAYHEKEIDFPIDSYTKKFYKTLDSWKKNQKREIQFSIQPGRYIIATAGICLTEVQSIKKNQGIDFVGMDLGFNFLLRPEFYNAYHKITHTQKNTKMKKNFTIVGNICESGDVLGKNRMLPKDINIGDILAIHDTGAYGFSMASNYNSMPRPAEILITTENKIKLIRKREKLSDLIANQIF